MIVYRLIFGTSILLLSACASKPQVSESSQNFKPLPQSNTPNIPMDSAANANGAVLNTKPLKGTNETLATNETLITKDDKGKGKVTDANLNKKLAGGENSAASKITSWDISGALAARSSGKGWSASLNWTQRGAGAYQFRLSGPIGSGTILITKSGGVVTLRDGKKSTSSSNAQSLLKQQTGVSLPVPNLYYWARGIPAPGAVSDKKYDESGRLRVLQQAGYTIEYQQYASVGKAVLPTSIRLQGNGVFMKLIIKNWRV